MSPGPTRREAMAALLGAAILPALYTSRAAAKDAVIFGTIHEVAIHSFAFDPAELTVAIGDAIRWSNADLSPRTASAEDGRCDTGPIEQSESCTFEVTEGMALSYQCLFHLQMRAKLLLVPV